MADPGFARGESTASAQSASLNGGLGAAPPSGRGPWAKPVVRGQGAKLKPFCPFSYKKWPKFKDLNENLPQGLRQTASRSHDPP